MTNSLYPEVRIAGKQVECFALMPLFGRVIAFSPVVLKDFTLEWRKLFSKAPGAIAGLESLELTASKPGTGPIVYEGTARFSDGATHGVIYHTRAHTPEERKIVTEARQLRAMEARDKTQLPPEMKPEEDKEKAEIALRRIMPFIKQELDDKPHRTRQQRPTGYELFCHLVQHRRTLKYLEGEYGWKERTLKRRKRELEKLLARFNWSLRYFSKTTTVMFKSAEGWTKRNGQTPQEDPGDDNQPDEPTE